ncbi:MAG TPA: dTMP kinase [Acidimicrobiia bacterium]|nr:dTMP kinase [Acidimicrobiia bacterium]
MNRYVAVEGIDGAGKSTLARDLVTALRQRGHTVTAVREPGGTPAGEAIREIVLGRTSELQNWTEALLFAAARAQLAATVVAPALERGDIVVTDRSYYSSLAYQGAGRGLGVDIVRTVNEAGLRGVVPGVIVLLRIDAEGGLAREDERDRISVEGVDLQRRVAAAYDALAAAEPERFVVVDATRPLSEIVAEVVTVLERRW